MLCMTCERDILPPLSWDFLCYLVLSTPSYEGEIQIMLWTPVSPLFFTCRSAFCTTCYNFQQKPWYKGSFGSTDQLQIFWTSSITMAQPILERSIDGRKGLWIPELMSLSWKAVRGPPLTPPQTQLGWEECSTLDRVLTSGLFLALMGKLPGLHIYCCHTMHIMGKGYFRTIWRYQRIFFLGAIDHLFRTLFGKLMSLIFQNLVI